jgi:hypothetical protein
MRDGLQEDPGLHRRGCPLDQHQRDDAARYSDRLGEVIGGRRRRARWAATAAAALCVALAAGVLVARRDASDSGRVDAGPTTTTADGMWPPTLFGVEAATPVVPSGWRVLELGDLRFAVPAAWEVPVARSCLMSDAPGAVIMAVDEGEQPDCSPVRPLPASVLTLEATGTASEPGGSMRLGMMTGSLIDAKVCDGCARTYQLDIGLRVTISGPDSDAVLATFTDSGAHRVLQQGPAAPIDGWRRVDYSGIELRVPPTWAVDDLPGSYTVITDPDGSPTGASGKLNPGACGRQMFPSGLPGRVSLGESMFTSHGCPVGYGLDLAPGDGVWIRPVDQDAASTLGTPIATSQVDGLAVTVIRPGDQGRITPQSVVDLLIDNGSTTLWMTIGTGLDPPTARAILATLRSA